MDLKQKLQSLEKLIGNTPLVKLDYGPTNLYAKVEYFNMMGSIKDRPAYYIISKAIEAGKINQQTTVIESTSGNFGLALAAICKKLGLKFIPVVDEMITESKEKTLRLLSHKLIKIKERDDSGGYLLNRIKKVREYISLNENVYHPNQYQNINNYLSYYDTLGSEICSSFSKLDFVFLCVSSGGTIAGISKKLKEHFKNVKIYGVDVKGSLIFQNIPSIRSISGIGSSMRSDHVQNASIDEVVILDELQIVEGCHNLIEEQMLFCGGSTGAVYYAAKSVLKNLIKHKNQPFNSLIICPDKGDAYLETIYNKDWVEKLRSNMEL